MALEAFKYTRGKLLVLDQIKLPHVHEYVEVKTTDDGWQVINKMQVCTFFFFENACTLRIFSFIFSPFFRVKYTINPFYL